MTQPGKVVALGESDARAQIAKLIEAVLKPKGGPHVAVTDGASLYERGIGLDSLDVAEFSARLEDHFGSDPYSANVIPQTVGEILSFYRTHGVVR